MVFVEEFIEDGEVDMSFELSKRKSLNLRVIKERVISENLYPFIIDASINGYSSKVDFDFEVDGRKWSDIKGVFIKGEEAQKDPEALTVKRAIRVCARATTEYIKKNDVKTHLYSYAPEGLSSCYMHLGGAFVVPENEKHLLIEMWENFDKAKDTSVLESVSKILTYRFR